MHILLILVLLTADGPKEKSFEQPSLSECWTRAQSVIESADAVKMGQAGYTGFGAGCIIVNGPSQDAGR